MRALLLLLGVTILSGQTGCYYAHLAGGQLSMLWQRRPIEDVVADPQQPAKVRALLGLVEEVRAFAIDLGLDVGDQYTAYVEWPGDRVVTTLVRTHADRLEVDPWWFPVLGHLPYKGYFDRQRAEREAERLRATGRWDVCVSGVSAYSTLGWLDDPVTAPMLARGAAPFVETLLHELVHATAYVASDADFNEGVAQFIGEQAAIRFFAGRERIGDTRLDDAATDREASAGAGPVSAPPEASAPSADRVAGAVADRQLVAEAILAFRDRVVELDDDPDRASKRAEAEEAARAHLAALPLAVLDAGKIARAARLSDACVALRGTYTRDAPRHAALLEALGGDLRALVARLRRWADEDLEGEAFFDLVDLDA